MEGSKEFLYMKKGNPPKTAIELLDLTDFFLPPAVQGYRRACRFGCGSISFILASSMGLSLDGTQALGPRRGVGCLWKLKAQESRKYFDSCPWCTDASWKLVPGASPHSSLTPPLPTAYKSQSIKYCLEDPFYPTPFWSSLPGRSLQQTKQREERMGNRQGCSLFICQTPQVRYWSPTRSDRLDQQCGQCFLASESTSFGCPAPEVGEIELRGKALPFVITVVSELKHTFSPGSALAFLPPFSA